ncbi:hypoxanthine phosphoribosyltransferase [Planctomycetaceae bacterium]|nr:hypoxanthine phosphoribosyltransferase [Planctomycetaceae bacterium]
MKVLIEAEKIREAVDQLGRRLATDYAGKQLTVVGVLTGSVMLLADLVRAMNLPLKISLIRASSYRGTATQAGKLEVDQRLIEDITGRDVVLVDDIFDSGRTLETLLETLRGHKPASLSSAVLLWKTGRQEVEVEPDYHCFRIPDVFVVGYGLDYDGDYRYLPYIAGLEDSELDPGAG